MSIVSAQQLVRQDAVWQAESVGTEVTIVGRRGFISHSSSPSASTRSYFLVGQVIDLARLLLRIAYREQRSHKVRYL